MDNIEISRSNGELIKKKVIFAPPPHDAIVKITDRKDDLIIESSEVVQNGDYVLVKGYLNKSFIYNTTNKALLNKLMGNEEGKDEQQDNDECDGKEDKDKDGKKEKKEVKCESLTPNPECMAVDGVVRHTTVWIPFEVLVHVPGAEEGYKVAVHPEPTVKALYKDDEIIEDGLIIGIVVNDVVTISVTATKAI